MSEEFEYIDDVELPDVEDNIEEEKGHDPEHAEKQSADSVDDTDKPVKKAPARKGDSKKQDAMIKQKAPVKDKAMPESAYDFPGELDALVESEATLSDEFKSKTAVIFETAITSKISEEVERLENEYQEKLSEEVESFQNDLVEKVDNYLNYVVENWMEENRIAVEAGLRAEIAEDFMGSLKDLFIESYIDVPESKVDLVDELADKVEELEEKLNEQTSSVLEMTEELEAQHRITAVRENSNGLAETEIEKLASLVESLEFESLESFSEKVKTVKESYFKKDASDETEEIIEEWEDETVETSGAMSAYVKAIKGMN